MRLTQGQSLGETRNLIWKKIHVCVELAQYLNLWNIGTIHIFWCKAQQYLLKKNKKKYSSLKDQCVKHTICLVESLTRICQSINPLLSSPLPKLSKCQRNRHPTLLSFSSEYFYIVVISSSSVVFACPHKRLCLWVCLCLCLRLLWLLLHRWYILIICVCVPLQVSLSLSLPPSPLNIFTSLIYPSHHFCLRAPPSEVISAEKYGRWDERTEVAGKLNKQWLYYSFTLLQPLLFCCQSDQVNICNNYQQHLCTVYVYVYSERSMVEEKRQYICFLDLQTRHSSIMVIIRAA